MTNLSTVVKDGAPGTRPLELTSSPRQSALGGLLVRQYRWGLSGRARFCLLIIVLTFAIQVGAEEFNSHFYHRVFTTGGPVAGIGGYVNDYQTAASVGAGLLKKAGIPAEHVQMVPSHVIGRDRTYSSAIALRDWLREHDVEVRSLNIVTEGAHARRTRLLFEKALGPGVAVGVIAASSPDFNAKRWWRYSEGVEDVIDQSVAYVYARFFFLPSQK